MLTFNHIEIHNANQQKTARIHAMSITPPLPLAQLRKHRKPLGDVNKEFHEKMSSLDKFALWITTRVGTIGFFLIIFVWSVLWLSWNIFAPPTLQFDPPMGFVLWLFISNMIQILLMPLIMVGQNIQGRHAEARAAYDLSVNVKAEEEIETVLEHLEYQNTLLMAMVEKLGVDLQTIKAKE